MERSAREAQSRRLDVLSGVYLVRHVNTGSYYCSGGRETSHTYNQRSFILSLVFGLFISYRLVMLSGETALQLFIYSSKAKSNEEKNSRGCKFSGSSLSVEASYKIIPFRCFVSQRARR